MFRPKVPFEPVPDNHRHKKSPFWRLKWPFRAPNPSRTRPWHLGQHFHLPHFESPLGSVQWPADAIIISFPLYYFCLPGMLTRFLVDYQTYCTARGKLNKQVKVYAIVNCGFPEPEINLEAVRVIQSFSRHLNAEFRFGVLIGGGSMMVAAKEAPFMKKAVQKLNSAFTSMAVDIQAENFTTMESIYIEAKYPFSRPLYYFMGGRGWITMARKNGLKKKELYRKPYRMNE